MELFLLTIFIIGYSAGALTILLVMLSRQKRIAESEESKARDAVACYRADVAMATLEERNRHDREVRELKGRINQALGMNYNLCKAINSGQRVGG